MVYEELKSRAGRPGLRDSLGLGNEVTGLEVSAMGAASKLAAVLATYPQQVIARLHPCTLFCEDWLAQLPYYCK